METIKLELEKALGAGAAEELKKIAPEIENAVKMLYSGSGAGSDYLGWLNLPAELNHEILSEIEASANNLRRRCRYVVAIGIGGSYLGAKAVIDALSNSFASYKCDTKTTVLFAGHNLGEDYLSDLQDFLSDKEFGLINISKSGMTTEPAVTFRLLKQQLEAKVGKGEAQRRIVAVTDAKKGSLRILANNEGYKTFVIPDNVGGRFSVFTPVGLLPIAVAGFDIRVLVAGAQNMMQQCKNASLDKNIAASYAAARNILYRQGKKIEILANFNPKLHYFAEWWKQLYGESEGKDGKGIFPASVDFTTDLHSMGQWIQEGERTIFETVISVENVNNTLVIPSDKDNLDALNYLAGKRVDYVNKMAELGTQMAHVDGGVPNIRIVLPAVRENFLGSLIYFFEAACAISGYTLGVNPFNQPGVEAYKKNMFKLLEKPEK